MPNLSSVPEILFFVVLITSFWPGIESPRHLDKPKKGYWTIATVFWPMRKAYQDLWPHHAVLEKGARAAHTLAALLTSVIFVIGIWAPIPAGWVAVEVVVVTFLLGRTSGFWSADRRIIEAQQADEAADAERQTPTAPRS
jgi:hypothetical protein